MRRFTTSAFFAAGLVLLLANGAAAAGAYTIDPLHTFVEFRIKHLGFSWMVGTFDKVTGDLTFDPATGEGGQAITVNIDTASIDTSHAERDKHLRSPDFLDVEKFPTASFASTGFKGDATGGVLTGTLTLHGVTKTVSFPVKPVGEGKDPWGGYRAGFEGELTIDRRDYGMDKALGPASWDVSLFFSVEGILKK